MNKHLIMIIYNLKHDVIYKQNNACFNNKKIVFCITFYKLQDYIGC